MELSVNGDRSVDSRSVDSMLVAQAREQASVATSGSAVGAREKSDAGEGEKEHSTPFPPLLRK